MSLRITVEGGHGEAELAVAALERVGQVLDVVVDGGDPTPPDETLGVRLTAAVELPDDGVAPRPSWLPPPR